jgi:disulfide bond formation protein DsbB
MANRALPATADPAYRAGAFALALALAVILAAHAFERFGGYAPCPLCLMQRYAYYAGVPGLFVALVLTTMARGRAAGLLFLLLSMSFLANAGLGIYHAGIEWKFWPGPDTCEVVRGLAPGKPGSLLERIEQAQVVRCDTAPWRLLGLSFAGWNAVVSFVLSMAALQAASAAIRH